MELNSTIMIALCAQFTYQDSQHEWDESGSFGLVLSLFPCFNVHCIRRSAVAGLANHVVSFFFRTVDLHSRHCNTRNEDMRRPMF